MQSVLVDAGPLIALFDRSEKYHRRVSGYLQRSKVRLITTWPVLAETCHFLSERSQIDLLRWADADGIQVIELQESALRKLADWKEKYLDLPMDLADASLVWVAQHTNVLEILTIDLRDFSVYRLPNGKALKPVLQH